MALVSAAKNGNQRAFEVLVERHQQRMLAFARRYTRVREDAEDVVQQAFQKAFYPLEPIPREIFLLDLVNTDRPSTSANSVRDAWESAATSPLQCVWPVRKTGFEDQL